MVCPMYTLRGNRIKSSPKSAHLIPSLGQGVISLDLARIIEVILREGIVGRIDVKLI